MKKDSFLLYIFLFLINVVFIQENSAQGNTVYDQSFNSSIRIGKVGETGDLNVERGAKTIQYNIV